MGFKLLQSTLMISVVDGLFTNKEDFSADVGYVFLIIYGSMVVVGALAMVYTCIRSVCSSGDNCCDVSPCQPRIVTHVCRSAPVIPPHPEVNNNERY